MTPHLTFLLYGLITFLHVFLRSGQQLNVVHDRRMLILPYSLGLQACEVFLVVSMVSMGPGWIILFGAIGATAGSITAMYVNKRWMNK